MKDNNLTENKRTLDGHQLLISILGVSVLISCGVQRNLEYSPGLTLDPEKFEEYYETAHDREELTLSFDEALDSDTPSANASSNARAIGGGVPGCPGPAWCRWNRVVRVNSAGQRVVQGATGCWVRKMGYRPVRGTLWYRWVSC